jgi:hypothetical protein
MSFSTLAFRVPGPKYSAVRPRCTIAIRAPSRTELKKSGVVKAEELSLAKGGVLSVGIEFFAA